MPVVRNFYLTHQWLRELKRWKGGTLVGAYFRLPAGERVMCGPYRGPQVSRTAAEAAAVLWARDDYDPTADRGRRGERSERSPEGFEVIVPRRIAPAEILRIKSLPQVVGWRYFPGSHAGPPQVCLCCERGNYGIRKLLRTVEAAEARDRTPKFPMFGREDDSFRRVARLRAELAGRLAPLPAD